jgi:hypothetical protein
MEHPLLDAGLTQDRCLSRTYPMRPNAQPAETWLPVSWEQATALRRSRRGAQAPPVRSRRPERWYCAVISEAGTGRLKW